MKTNKLQIDDIAPDFNLLGVDNLKHSLSYFDNVKVLVIMFTCNHCPVVKAYENRLIKIQDDYKNKKKAKKQKYKKFWL